jgi:hypothetical protein
MRSLLLNSCLIPFFLFVGWGWPSSHAQNIIFTPTASIHVGKAPQSIVTGDFNGDALLDLATVNSTSDDVTILLGNGNGTFQAPVSFGIGKIPMSVATADVNGDARLDLVVAISGSDHIVVLKGKGDGFFDRIGSYPSGKGTTFLSLADLNQDDKPDVVAVNSGRFGYYPPFSLSVLFNEGDGKFTEPVTYETEGRNGMFPTGVLAQDITGDGLADLAVTWSQPSWRSPNGMISLLVNSGQGKFSLKQELYPGYTLSAIAGGDVDGNGYLDLVTTSLYLDSVIVLFQDDQGDFQKLNPIHVGFSPVAVALGDLDGDDRLDVVTTNRDSNSVSVLVQRKNGSFRKAGHFGVGGTPSSLVIEDFDRDGLPDLVTADSNSNAVSVLLSGGEGIPLPSVSAETLVFQVTSKDQGREPQPVRLSNIGLGPLRIVAVNLIGQDPEAFAVMEDQCAGTTLRTGDFCVVQIAFTSESQGSHTATMTIWDNANGSPRIVALKGIVDG